LNERFQRFHLMGHSHTHTHTHSHLNERTGSFSLWMTPRTSAIALVRTSPHKCDCTCAQKRNILTCQYQRYCTGWWRPIGCLKSQIILRKRTFIIGLFCGKWPVNIRHPMTLRHPVSIVSNRSIAMELTCQHSPWWLSLWSCLATISISKFSQVSSVAIVRYNRYGADCENLEIDIVGSQLHSDCTIQYIHISCKSARYLFFSQVVSYNTFRVAKTHRIL